LLVGVVILEKIQVAEGIRSQASTRYPTEPQVAD